MDTAYKYNVGASPEAGEDRGNKVRTIRENEQNCHTANTEEIQDSAKIKEEKSVTDSCTSIPIYYFNY